MKWTDQETTLLRQLYPSTPRKELVQRLGRTEKVIRTKASKMGVRKNKSAKGARNIRPVGTERVDKYQGLIIRKITNTGRPKKDWKRVDVIEWEALHGPIPPGHTLMLKNAALPRTQDNLALFTRSEHFARVSLHNMAPELAELFQLKAQISRTVNQMTKAKRSPAP